MTTTSSPVLNSIGDPMLSHPLKTGIEYAIHYTKKAQATIHKSGCSHPAESKKSFSGVVYEDDYYDVAPCARGKS